MIKFFVILEANKVWYTIVNSHTKDFELFHAETREIQQKQKLTFFFAKSVNYQITYCDKWLLQVATSCY
jgi:hypothetical protein